MTRVGDVAIRLVDLVQIIWLISNFENKFCILFGSKLITTRPNECISVKKESRMLSQGNGAMPQLFVAVYSSPTFTTSLTEDKLSVRNAEVPWAYRLSSKSIIRVIILGSSHLAPWSHNIANLVQGEHPKVRVK